MIKAIFYDFDGVIKESTQIKTEAFYSLYLPYGEDIAKKAQDHHIAHGGISRYEKFKLYHKTFLGIDLNAAEIDDLANQFSKIVLQKVVDSNYVPGALTSIKKLNHKYNQYIVTGTPQSEIEFILKALDIDSYFDGVYGSPDNKIMISQKILKLTKLKTNEVVFIGDATTDFNAANHYSFHFILREHIENHALFKDQDIIKSKDLINLENLIDNL